MLRNWNLLLIGVKATCRYSQMQKMADPRKWQDAEERAGSRWERSYGTCRQQKPCCSIQLSASVLKASGLGKAATSRRWAGNLRTWKQLTELILAAVQLRETAMCLKFENWPASKMLSERERSSAMQPWTPHTGKHSVWASPEFRNKQKKTPTKHRIQYQNYLEKVPRAISWILLPALILKQRQPPPVEGNAAITEFTAHCTTHSQAHCFFHWKLRGEKKKDCGWRKCFWLHFLFHSGFDHYV